MLSEVQAINVEPRIVAVARGRVASAPLGPTMLGLLTEAWTFVRKTGLKNMGINVAMYPPDEAPGVAIEAGVEVPAAFAGGEGVRCKSTPGGAVATVMVMGEYREIPAAHAAIGKWCQANGRATMNFNWEVDGHHTRILQLGGMSKK